MNIDRKQAGTIFIAFIFIMSGVSIAFTLDTPTQNTAEDSNVLTQPISDNQRFVFIDEDVTILTLFYVEEDSDSLNMIREIEKINDEMGDKLLVEEIDVNRYGSFSAEYNVRNVPTILVRGNKNKEAPLRIEGYNDYEEIKVKVCETFKEKPSVCV